MKPTIKLAAIILLSYALAIGGAFLVPSAQAQGTEGDRAAAAAAQVAPAAAPAATPELASADTAKPPATQDDPWSAAVAAAKQGAWLAMLASIMVALIAFLRRKEGRAALAKHWKWIGTDRGGAALVLFLGAVGEVITSLATRNTAAPGATATLLAALAAGGRHIVKSLLTPKDAASSAAEG